MSHMPSNRNSGKNGKHMHSNLQRAIFTSSVCVLDTNFHGLCWTAIPRSHLSATDQQFDQSPQMGAALHQAESPKARFCPTSQYWGVVPLSPARSLCLQASIHQTNPRFTFLRPWRRDASFPYDGCHHCTIADSSFTSMSNT